MRQYLFKLSFLLLSLTSCASFQQDDGFEQMQVFKYNESSGIVSLDPAFAKDLPHIWVCNQLFNGLVALDSTMQLIPDIASHWEISEDGCTYRFHLRTDVKFHTDQKFIEFSRIVKAQDFIFSFNRLVNPKLASPGAWIFEAVERTLDGELAMEALNDSCLLIRLKKPFPPFLGMLTMAYASVLPEEIYTDSGSEQHFKAVGTGPFLLRYWKEGVKLVLVRNPEYFESTEELQIPMLDAVSISFLIDRQTAFMEFIKGNLDYMSGIDVRYKDELLNRDGSLRLKYTDRLALIREPFMNTEYLGFYIGLESDDPVRDRMLRIAVSMLIDRQNMLRFLRNNIGKPGHGGMIPYGMPGYGENIGYSYNPKKAVELIDKFDLRALRLVLSTTAEYTDLLKFIQSQLEDVGLKAEIEILPPATMREQRANGQLPIFRASWVADYPDAENYIGLFLSRNFCPIGPNYTHYSNILFDSLYQHSMQIAELKDRIPIYRELDSLMMQDAPVVILYYDEVLRFVHKNISGLGSNPTNQLDLRFVVKKNHKELAS